MTTIEQTKAKEKEERDARRIEFLAKRAARDIKKAAATGKISNFLEKQALTNESVRNALAAVNSYYNAPEQLAASITYKEILPADKPIPKEPYKMERIQPTKVFDVCVNGVPKKYIIPAIPI